MDHRPSLSLFMSLFNKVKMLQHRFEQLIFISILRKHSHSRHNIKKQPLDVQCRFMLLITMHNFQRNKFVFSFIHSLPIGIDNMCKNMILANRVGPWCPKIIIDSTWLYSHYFHLIQSNKPSFIWKWHLWDNFRDIFLIKQCWTEASSVTYMLHGVQPNLFQLLCYFHQERNYCVSNYFQSMYLI